jgi:polygalacturonase
MTVIKLAASVAVKTDDGPRFAATQRAAASVAAAAAAPKPHGGMGISVADFGAAGDGHTDDTAALQAGIDAAQTTGRALLVPARDRPFPEK